MLEPVILIGEPLIFEGKIKIYPPTVKEVVSNPKFGIFYRLLTMTQDDVRDELKERVTNEFEFPVPFEYLLLSAQYVNGFSELVKEAISFFCRVEVVISFEEKQFIIDDEIIDNNNFFDFQNIIRRACGDKPEKEPQIIDPNEDPRIRRIKEKARERDKIKARQSGKNGISLSTCLVAICCMGIGLTPLNIGEMSYASVGELMKVMQNKEKYDIDIRSLLAGADSKKVKPKYWIRNTND